MPAPGRNLRHQGLLASASSASSASDPGLGGLDLAGQDLQVGRRLLLAFDEGRALLPEHMQVGIALPAVEELLDHLRAVLGLAAPDRVEFGLEGGHAPIGSAVRAHGRWFIHGLAGPRKVGRREVLPDQGEIRIVGRVGHQEVPQVFII